MSEWLAQLPILPFGLLVLFVMAVASFLGALLQRYEARIEAAGGMQRNETQEGYAVGAVLSLLALLIGFTFALALDRYDNRRVLVVEDARAIETLYLRAQLLDEPHRSRFNNILVRYVDNRVTLAQTGGEEGRRLLAANDRLLVDLWTATVPAFDSIRGIDFSSSFVDSVNQVIELDAARKAARTARIPAAFFWVLMLCAVVAAFMLGNVVTGRRAWAGSVIVLVLFVLWVMLLVDINRPVTGVIRESQAPMERLAAMMRAAPPTVFDRLRTPSTPARP